MIGAVTAWFAGNKILSAVGSVLKPVFGFFSSTAGLMLIALLFGYYAGHKQAGTATLIASLRTQVSTLQADLHTEKVQNALAKKEYASISELIKGNVEKMDALNKLLAEQNSGRRECLLSPEHARRLRNIK